MDDNEIKIVIIGDGAVGKTCILFVYAKNEFPRAYVPTVFDNYKSEVTVNGKKHDLMLWDTAGQEDYDSLRNLSYPGTKVFVFCYSVANRDSYENILSKWHPEIKKHMPSPIPPIVLVGTKADLRKDPKRKNLVSEDEGRRLAQKIGAVKYVECSAMERTGVKDVFDEAIKAHLFPPTKPKKKSGCIIA